MSRDTVKFEGVGGRFSGNLKFPSVPSFPSGALKLNLKGGNPPFELPGRNAQPKSPDEKPPAPEQGFFDRQQAKLNYMPRSGGAKFLLAAVETVATAASHVAKIGYNSSGPGLGLYVLEKAGDLTGLSKLAPQKLKDLKPYLPSYGRNLEMAGEGLSLGVGLIKEPSKVPELAKEIWRQEWKPLVDRGEYARLSGHVAANLALLAVGPKGAGASAKTARLAEDIAFASAKRVNPNVLAMPAKVARKTPPVFDTVLVDGTWMTEAEAAARAAAAKVPAAVADDVLPLAARVRQEAPAAAAATVAAGAGTTSLIPALGRAARTIGSDLSRAARGQETIAETRLMHAARSAAQKLAALLRGGGNGTGGPFGLGPLAPAFAGNAAHTASGAGVVWMPQQTEKGSVLDKLNKPMRNNEDDIDAAAAHAAGPRRRFGLPKEEFELIKSIRDRGDEFPALYKEIKTYGKNHCSEFRMNPAYLADRQAQGNAIALLETFLQNPQVQANRQISSKFEEALRLRKLAMEAGNASDAHSYINLAVHEETDVRVSLDTIMDMATESKSRVRFFH